MNFDRGAISYWIAFRRCLLPHLLSSFPPLHVPETGGGITLFGLIAGSSNPGLTPLDELRSTRVPSLANTDPRLLANDGPRHRWPRSWGLLVPPPRNRRNRLNCDVYGPSRKIDARPMALLEAFVASFLPFALLKQGIWQMRVKVLEETMDEI